MQKRLQIKFSRVLKLFLQAGFVFLAILCGLSRIKDNKHRPSDVIAGFILGISVAVFVVSATSNSIYYTIKFLISDEIHIDEIC